MKVRLIKGPFAGKVINHPEAGTEVIRIKGDKPMTREQRYEHAYQQYKSLDYYAGSLTPRPVTTADYKICYRVHSTGGPDGQFFNLPCQHPDGSIFYEYVKNSRKDW